LEAKGDLSIDCYGNVYLQGVGADGENFSIVLDNESARRLIFKLHRMVLEAERIRVKESKGGAA
jgi:hypothetical protein